MLSAYLFQTAIELDRHLVEPALKDKYDDEIRQEFEAMRNNLLRLMSTLELASALHGGTKPWKIRRTDKAGNKFGDDIYIPRELMREVVEKMSAVRPDLIYDCIPYWQWSLENV